ncbi:hypothetical protein Brsp01_31590 [Brucella sp. NBRC 12950]|jgi:hypothetical protein|nr:hypothetical protein Brsp01_31590 [Brucella sp. NBRC 12950]
MISYENFLHVSSTNHKTQGSCMSVRPILEVALAMTPVYAPTANVGVAVIMLCKGEAGARGAFDAADVLKQACNV